MNSQKEYDLKTYKAFRKGIIKLGYIGGKVDGVYMGEDIVDAKCSSLLLGVSYDLTKNVNINMSLLTNVKTEYKFDDNPDGNGYDFITGTKIESEQKLNNVIIGVNWGISLIKDKQSKKEKK